LTVWIANEDQLEKEVRQWPIHTPIGLDTEFMRVNTFFPKLALVQARVDHRTLLIDAPALNGQAFLPLTTYLSASNTLSIMHSASEDLEALAHILPVGPCKLFDTQIAAAMAGLGYGLSYQKLVFTLLNVEISKSETRSDWLRRPLSSDQLEYANQDVLYLPDMYLMLAEKLHALERYAWLVEDCERMIARVAKREPDPQPQRSFRRLADWPREKQARLRKLLLWREKTARELNCPKLWIFDEIQAIRLIEAATPSSVSSLKSSFSGLRRLSPEKCETLRELLVEPVTPTECNETVSIPALLSTRQKHCLKALKNNVIALAEQLQLPESLLCSSRQLEFLITQQQWPDALNGWRKRRLYAQHTPLVSTISHLPMTCILHCSMQSAKISG